MLFINFQLAIGTRLESGLVADSPNCLGFIAKASVFFIISSYYQLFVCLMHEIPSSINNRLHLGQDQMYSVGTPFLVVFYRKIVKYFGN
jgi:hypothetical protein